MNNLLRGQKGGCVPGYTPILMSDGTSKPIKDIQVGDVVMSYDMDNQLCISEVKNIYITPNKEVIRLNVWQGEIDLTPSQWVQNQHYKFSNAGFMEVNDALIDKDGFITPIHSIEKLENQDVYNLNVEPHHTYIANNIRIHNSGLGYSMTDSFLSGSKGGGKGGSGAPSRPAQEDPNTLRSKAIVRVQDLLSEGEIVGLVNGAKSIYFDNTQYQANDDTLNFGDLNWDFRYGTPDQASMPQFQGTETPRAISQLELDPDSPPAPQNITLASGITSVRLGVIINALYESDKNNGDVHGSEVTIKVQYRIDSGAWQDHIEDNIVGKTTTPYERTYLVPRPAGVVTDWDVRIIRTSPLPQDSAVVNAIFWHLMVELVERQFSYPDTAYIGVAVDAEKVGGQIPKRSYHLDGIKIQLPSNYTPLAYDASGNITTEPSYTGVWDGTFTTAWSNNPAWVLYDLIQNDRYGIGEFVDTSQIDKYAFYTIGQYCDEMVDDGNGGTEPRYTFNGVINSREDAYKVLQAVASTFRGMIYWSSGAVGATQDSPKDPVKLVNPENVIDGSFTYSGTGLKDRHTSVAVTWNNPEDAYNADIEYVEDSNLVKRYGQRPMDLYAVGCTSRGQAWRLGKWLLHSEHNETETISYRASFDHMDVVPGDIVRVADPVKAGVESGGRIQGATTTSIDLEQSFTFTQATGYKIHWVRSRDETQPVTNVAGSYTVITVSAFSEIPVIFADATINGSDNTVQRARIVGSTINSVTLDTTINLRTGISYDIKVERLVVESRDVSNGIGPATTVTTTSAFSETPVTHNNYIISHVDSGTRLFKVVSVKEVEPAIFEVAAVLHDENKYTTIEDGIILPPSDRSRYDYSQIAAPTNLTATLEPATTATYDITYDIKCTWDAVDDPALSNYKLTYRFEGGNLKLGEFTDSTTAYIENAPEGSYTIYVTATNKFGFESVAAVLNFDATTPIPLTPTGFEILEQGNNENYGGRDINLQWRRTSIFAVGALDTLNSATTRLNPWFRHWKLQVLNTLGEVIREEYITDNFYTYSYEKNVEDGGPNRELVFKLWAVDKSGKQSATPAVLDVDNPLPSIPNITLTPQQRAIQIKFARPNDLDYSRVRVYRSTDSNDLTGDPDDGFLIYEGDNARITDSPLDDGTEYFYKLDFIDAFGSGNYSSVLSATSGTLSVSGASISGVSAQNDATFSYNTSESTVLISGMNAGKCIRARVIVTTPWDVNEVLSINKIDGTVVIDFNDVDLTTEGIYEKNIWIDNIAGDSIRLATLTQSNSPTQGSAIFLLETITD